MRIGSTIVSVWYGTGRVLRNILCFLNLLEPDVPQTTLSLSKLSVWASMCLTLYVVVFNKGTQDIAGALLANLGSIGNYAYRRHIQVKTGTGAYGGSCADESDDSDDTDPAPEEANPSTYVDPEARQ